MITKTGQEALEKDAWLSGALKAGKSLLSKGKAFLSGGASKSTGGMKTFSGTSRGASKATSGAKSSPFNTTSAGSVNLGKGGKSTMGKAKDMLSGAGTRAKWGLGGMAIGGGAIGSANKASPKKTRTPTGPPNQMM